MKNQLQQLKTEFYFLKKGFKFVVGIDEAGRGPLAGPVVACALYISDFQRIKNSDLFSLINDSKKLTPKKRDEIFNYFSKKDYINFAFGVVNNNLIDKINIKNASLLAMKNAFLKLNLKGEESIILIDGKDIIESLSFSQKSIISGDSSVLTIALASVFAKKMRDDIMKKYARIYPEYEFEKHKGYGTKRHRELILKNGICKIHRLTFIKNYYEAKK